MGLEDLVPLYGERSTKDKVDEVFGYLDKKLSLQFFISMFLVEAVKNYVGGSPGFVEDDGDVLNWRGGRSGDDLTSDIGI